MEDFDRFDEAAAALFLAIADSLRIEWMLRQLAHGLAWCNERLRGMIDDQVDASVEDETVEHDWQAYHEFLTEGVQVLYVMTDGQKRPAIVVRAWKAADAPDLCNLCVFLDGHNDARIIPPGTSMAGGMLIWATSVHYAPPEDAKPGSWQYMDEDMDEDEAEPDTIIDDMSEAG